MTYEGHRARQSMLEAGPGPKPESPMWLWGSWTPQSERVFQREDNFFSLWLLLFPKIVGTVMLTTQNDDSPYIVLPASRKFRTMFTRSLLKEL